MFDCFFIILTILSISFLSILCLYPHFLSISPSLLASTENMAQEEGICIANTESVIHNAEDSKFDEIVLNLQEYKATAKVSYCFRLFFHYLHHRPKKGAVYKLCEDCPRIYCCRCAIICRRFLICQISFSTTRWFNRVRELPAAMTHVNARVRLMRVSCEFHVGLLRQECLVWEPHTRTHTRLVADEWCPHSPSANSAKWKTLVIAVRIALISGFQARQRALKR